MGSYIVYSPLAVIFITFVIMAWFDKLPSTNTIHDWAEIANTKGGSIVLLYFMSLLFFFAGIRFGYWMITNSQAKEINPLAMAMFGFITGSAFGGAFSAMLKTMTGDSTMGTISKETTERTTVSSTVPGPEK